MCGPGEETTFYNGSQHALPAGTVLPNGEVVLSEVVVTAPSSGADSYSGQWWIESAMPAAAQAVQAYGLMTSVNWQGVVAVTAVTVGSDYVLNYDLNMSNESASHLYADHFEWYNPYSPNPEIQH